MVDDNKEIVMKLDFKQCLVSFLFGAIVMGLVAIAASCFL